MTIEQLITLGFVLAIWVTLLKVLGYIIHIKQLPNRPKPIDKSKQDPKPVSLFDPAPSSYLPSPPKLPKEIKLVSQYYEHNKDWVDRNGIPLKKLRNIQTRRANEKSKTKDPNKVQGPPK